MRKRTGPVAYDCECMPKLIYEGLQYIDQRWDILILGVIIDQQGTFLINNCGSVFGRKYIYLTLD